MGILSTFKPAELGQLADVMVRTKVAPDTNILTQGEEGDMFYILEEGSAIALKDGNQVMKYAEGDYFGELALLNKNSGMRCSRPATLRMALTACSEIRVTDGAPGSHV